MSWLHRLSPSRSGGRRDFLKGATSKARRRRRALGPASSRLEALETRALLSTTYPLDTTIWTALGPAPIVDGYQFANSGEPVSGRVAGVAADPKNPDIDYIAAAGGGVWKTVNAGRSWTPLTDDQSTLFMGAISVAPGDGRVIYAGTGEADNSGDSDYGHGILVSRDGGAHWALTTAGGAFERETVARIAIDPTDAAIAYAAVADFGVNGLINGNTGIWKTTDYGAHWTDTTRDAGFDPYDPYSDVVIDALDPRVVYGAIGNAAGNATNGVLKSTDGGVTWAYDGDLPAGDGDGWIKLAISPTNPNYVYASIANGYLGSGPFGSLQGLYQSTDAGATWALKPNTPNYLGTQGWYDNTIAVDPSDPQAIYAGGQVDYNTGGTAIVESRDGGDSWSDLSIGVDGHGPHTDHHALAFDADGRLLDGNDGGIWRLDDPTPGGLHWADLNTNIDTIQYTGIATDPSNPDVAFGAPRTTAPRSSPTPGPGN